MKALKTSTLLKELVNYSFYDWEDTTDHFDKYFLYLGMSEEILKNLNRLDFYDSWGNDAVNNPYADNCFTSEQWNAFEQAFFNWLMTAWDILNPNNYLIVTPQLSTWWYLFDEHPPKWTSKNKWIKNDYYNYIEMLSKAGIINQDNENFRGGVIEDLMSSK